MGQFLSTNKRVHASRMGLSDKVAGGGLSSRGHGDFVPDLFGRDLRDHTAPPPLGATRGGSILERLLGALDPAAAPVHARTLLREFGSLSALLNAAPEEIDRALSHAVGAGEVIAAARDFTHEALRQQVYGTPVHGADGALHRYLQSILGGLREERLLVVFADCEGRYIADEQMGSGGVDNLHLNFRSVVRRAMALEAAAILLAHNHPSGVAKPSARDIEVTRKIAAAGRCLGIHVIDHLIVTGTSIYSIVHERAA